MYKKTKIVATISDMRCDVSLIQRLYDAGMNVVRLNTAHQDAKGMKRVIDNVREVSSHLAILVDTKGPEVRTTVTEAPIEFHKGEIVSIVGNPELMTTRSTIAVTYKDFVKDVHVGAHIPISERALQELECWYADRCHIETKPGEEDYVFVSHRRGKHLSRITVFHNLQVYAERVQEGGATNLAFFTSYTQ